MINQCQSGPGPGGAGLSYPVRPSCPATAVQNGKRDCRFAAHQAHTFAIVLSSWTRGLFQLPGHAFWEEGGWCRRAAVRHHCSRPHATSTAPPHQQSRHTCSGYGSRRSPEPCACRSDPWPCIQPSLAPGPRSVLSQRTQRSDRCSFAQRRDSSTDPDFTGSAECLCLVGTKTGNEEHKQERRCPWPRHICKHPRWIAPHQKEVFYFATGRLTFVEMAICRIDTSFPLHQRQLLQAGPLPLKPPRSTCSSTSSVAATRRPRLREVRWANLGAMHCQSRPRLQVARQVDLGRFLAKLDRFPLEPSGC